MNYVTESEKTVNKRAPTVFNRAVSDFNFYRKEFTNNTQCFPALFIALHLQEKKTIGPYIGFC
jgi:hypothetical protein